MLVTNTRTESDLTELMT